MSKWLLYGANGYSGHLILRLATEKGLKPVIAGRNEQEIKKIAAEFGLEYKIFSLDEQQVIVENIKEFDVVLHCAGPFSRTAKPMAEACCIAKTHYLDITGEITVFQMMQEMNTKAQEAGVMILPGVGFDVVPSDCLAAHLKSRLPDAKHLSLAFRGAGGISHGTATTMAENIGDGGCVRRDGKMIKVKAAWDTKVIDFGDNKPKTAVTIPWGDVFTAYYSTDIPNIEVYMAAPSSMIRGMKMSRYVGPLLASKPIQKLIKKRIKKQPAGPNDQERMMGVSLLWGQAKNDAQTVTSRIKGPEGYTFTALTSIAIVEEVLQGNTKKGFQTPSQVYGADFVLKIDGVTREDL